MSTETKNTAEAGPTRDVNAAKAAFWAAYQGAWAKYQKRATEAYDEYQQATKAIWSEAYAAAPPPDPEASLADQLAHTQQARLRVARAALDAQARAQLAERKYSEALTTSFWDVIQSIADEWKNYWHQILEILINGGVIEGAQPPVPWMANPMWSGTPDLDRGSLQLFGIPGWGNGGGV